MPPEAVVDTVPLREGPADCGLVPGECYPMEVWRRCDLSRVTCLRLPITEVDPMPEAEATPVVSDASDAAPAQVAPSAQDAPGAPVSGDHAATGHAATETDAPSATTEAVDGDGAVSAAADAASKIGGDYAPLLAVILAAVAVLGGSKAWSYYKERSAQKHELAMRELEIRAQAQGLNGAQPPPCQAAQAKIEAEIEGLKGRLAAVEKKAATLSADFDGEDIERTLKKLTKTVKAMQEDRA